MNGRLFSVQAHAFPKCPLCLNVKILAAGRPVIVSEALQGSPRYERSIHSIALCRLHSGHAQVSACLNMLFKGFRTWGCPGVASDCVFVTKNTCNGVSSSARWRHNLMARRRARATLARRHSNFQAVLVAAALGGVSGFLGFVWCGTFRILDHGPRIRWGLWQNTVFSVSQRQR